METTEVVIPRRGERLKSLLPTGEFPLDLFPEIWDEKKEARRLPFLRRLSNLYPKII
jgi:hypothetical protein